MKDLDLIVVKEFCADRLEEISKMFTPDCKLTLIVRKPGNDNADFILSDDIYTEVIGVLDRRMRPTE